MPITPQSAKAKGRKFQQQVRDKLLEMFDEILSTDDIRSVSMGASGSDLLLSPLAQAVLPYDFELKKQQTPNLWQAFAQSSRRCNQVPIAIFSCNNLPLDKCVVAMPEDHFFGLVSGTPHTYDLSRVVPAVTQTTTAPQMPVVDMLGVPWIVDQRTKPVFNLWKEWPSVCTSSADRKVVLVARDNWRLALVSMMQFIMLTYSNWRASAARAKLLSPVVADAQDQSQSSSQVVNDDHLEGCVGGVAVGLVGAETK